MAFELIHKPTFVNQLLGLPRHRLGQILAKVEALREDPLPDGAQKRKLTGYSGKVYRLRVGDYRVVYTFGDGWVSLLGVDDRKDVYRGTQLVAEGPAFDIGELPDLSTILQPTGQTDCSRERRHDVADDGLPVELNEDFLARLHVPKQYHVALRACKTLDDMVNVSVPEVVKERVFDVISSPDFDRVLQQADYVTGDASDLLRFAEGELLGFLLKLDHEQEKFVSWAINGSGPVLLKGGPGTGKSTVALYRTQALFAALRKAGNSSPRLLFTTYTNALVTFSHQLLSRLMGDDVRCVEVRTADSMALDVVQSVDGRQEICRDAQLRPLLIEAVTKSQVQETTLPGPGPTQTIHHLTPDYLLEEIGTVIDGRELKCLDEYLSSPRPGRRVPLSRDQRTAVWRVHQSFSALLKERRLRTWHQLRRRAAEIVREGGGRRAYDGVVIDESQDLDPAALRVLVGLCRTPDRLFITADANQSIYGGGFRWAAVHSDLRFRGRTACLRANYRSTKEIGEAAHSYLASGALEEYDPSVEPTYIHSGPQPAVRVVRNSQGETQLLARFLPGAAREFHLGLGSCAVLVPSEKAGRAVADSLYSLGVEASFMAGKELDLGRPAVKVLTLKAAKGLEFPVVAIAGFAEAPIPGIPTNAEAEETEEAVLRERRTLFVAMTRAMRALLVVVPTGEFSPVFQGFDERFWNSDRYRDRIPSLRG